MDSTALALVILSGATLFCALELHHVANAIEKLAAERERKDK